MSELRFETVAVHGGSPAVPDPYGAHAAPIYQTSTYRFPSVDAGARAFAGEPGGASHIYSRLGNPTVEMAERAIASLEGHGGDADAEGILFGSGMAAISTVLTALASGGRVVAQDALYGCTSEFLSEQAPGLGIERSFVDTTDPDAVREALASGDVRMLYVETPANPTMRICDLGLMAELAHDVGALLCVDNTFATPYHQQPLELGADVVVHSTTKYLNGHGTAIGGAAVVRDPEHRSAIDAYRKNLGGVAGPFDAWLLLNGLRTLSLRMERHASNADRIARWLRDHPAVARVHYPGLRSHPQHDLAARQMRRGFGGMITFELHGGFDAGEHLMNGVRLCALAVSLGSVDTLVQHPASMTHSVVPEALRRAAGITDGLVRISVGIEAAEDIVADLEQALPPVPGRAA